MKTIISISFLLFLSSVFYSCKRVTEKRTVELNQIFDMKARKWYSCKIGQDSTFFFKITKVDDNQDYGKICSQSTGGTIIVYFKGSLNGVEKDFELIGRGCSGEFITPMENPLLPNQDISQQVKLKLLKVYPISDSQDAKPFTLGRYDFKIVFYKQ
ncbi:MAG: hypothetical protein FGM14_08215 [Flavobacteriales bacterium]|nr:hypothetical protein [Flavobacteriales bacterium]